MENPENRFSMKIRWRIRISPIFVKRTWPPRCSNRVPNRSFCHKQYSGIDITFLILTICIVSNFTSLIPGNASIPEPSGPKWVGIAISILLTVGFVLLIIFIAYEFVRDQSGSPIEFYDSSHSNIPDNEPTDSISDHSSFAMSPQFRLLSPLPKSGIVSDKVTILCTWKTPPGSPGSMPLASMTLWIDEAMHPWDMQFGSNTWLATVKLTSGEHRLRTPMFETTFYLQGADAGLEGFPEGWKPFSAHDNIADPKQCDTCHYRIDRPEDMVRTGHELTIGAWKGYESCMTCHKAEDFQRKHLHKLMVYDDCRLCHTVHGSTETERPLLRAPKSRLCVQCHEAP